jgi:hypothetical protein
MEVAFTLLRFSVKDLMAQRITDAAILGLFSVLYVGAVRLLRLRRRA